MTDVQRWLIRPPANAYEGINVAIHHISPEMTADSPTMVEIWPEVDRMIDGRLLVAHYAAFDMSVLRNSLLAGTGQWPDLAYLCTRALARRAWPGRISYRLVDLADECGLVG